MPGMMDSILNIGLNDDNVQNLAKAFNDERFALDSYRRLIQMYSNVVLGVEMDRFEAVIACLLYTSPSPRDRSVSRMPSSA